jgi:hypothetical protein
MSAEKPAKRTRAEIIAAAEAKRAAEDAEREKIAAEQAKALAELVEIEHRHMKRGQKLIAEAIADGEDVVRVYDLCRRARTSAPDWLKEHWGMSAKSAQNYVMLYRHRDRLPEKIKPTVALKLVAPHVSDEVRETVLGLVADGAEVSVALVDKLIRDDVFTESISLVASYLLERKAKPREIVNELSALKAEIDSRRASGLVFDETFTDAVQQRAIAQREAERGPRVVLFSRWQAGVGGGMFAVQDVPAELSGADGRVFRLIVEEVQAA